MVREFEYRVVETGPVAEGIVRSVLEAGELASELQAGQFVMLEVPGDPSQMVRIPLSFAGSDAAQGTVELVYAVVGDGTRRLAQLPVGTRAQVLGPCGNGWRTEDLLSDAGQAQGEPRVLLVAGGIGVTPIVGAARALSAYGVGFDAIVAAQTATRLWGVDELEELGAQVVVCTDDGSRGVAGFATKAVPHMLAERTYAQVWTCGPAPMMAGVARLSLAAGLACHVSLERMMSCGFGACHCCNVALAGGGYAGCCTDGPVFDAQEVAW